MDQILAPKCVIILSTKCSGSSALQRRLTALPGVRHVSKTRHSEQETLYWTKAASILELPQTRLPQSEVPIEPVRARTELLRLLEENIPDYGPPPSDDEALIFDGWEQLCNRFLPVFVEKSPHHLHQWSALELILRCMDAKPHVQFYVIGLIRNPMAVLYSMWQQWGILPEEGETHYCMAYRNLLRLNPILNERLLTVRYEDMVRDEGVLRPAYEFIGTESRQIPPAAPFHAKSVAKWKSDPFFGFQLHEETANLAEAFGYERDEIANNTSWLWGPYKHLAGGARGTLRSLLPVGARKKLKAFLK